MSEITILIADDHPIFQKGLQQIIESDSALKIIAAVSDGAAALEGIRILKPRVAVLDVDMPEMDGFAVLNAARAEHLPTEVVLLTMHREERFLSAAISAGVKGYVLKDSAITEITQAIHSAAKGENFVSPALSTLLLKRVGTETGKTSVEALSQSERRVLELVAESKSNKQIADQLFISVRTVENHRANICAKLGIGGKNALLSYALTNRELFLQS